MRKSKSSKIQVEICKCILSSSIASICNIINTRHLYKYLRKHNYAVFIVIVIVVILCFIVRGLVDLSFFQLQLSEQPNLRLSSPQRHTMYPGKKYPCHNYAKTDRQRHRYKDTCYTLVWNISLSNLTRKIKTGVAPPRLTKKDQILTQAYNAPFKRYLPLIFDKISKHPFWPKTHKTSTNMSKNFQVKSS